MTKLDFEHFFSLTKLAASDAWALSSNHNAKQLIVLLDASTRSELRGASCEDWKTAFTLNKNHCYFAFIACFITSHIIRLVYLYIFH